MSNYNIPYYPTKSEKEKEYIAKCSKERWQDPNYHKDTSEKIAEAYSTPEMREMQANKFAGKTHTQETKDKIASHFVGKERPKEVVEKIKEKRKGRAVYHKPFKIPSGAFPSKKEAIEWALEKGVRNPQGKFDKWIKERPNEFYYISKEEYEKIKDDPKIEGLPWMENSKRLRKYRDEK